MIFYKIDTRSNNHYLRIKKGDISKTVFRSRYGHAGFRVLSFRLVNAPTTFMDVINRVFRIFLDTFVVVFLDDILMYSNDVDNHTSHLRLVLRKLKEQQVFTKLSKCEFWIEEVKFPSHVISKEGDTVDPSKIEAIEDW